MRTIRNMAVVDEQLCTGCAICVRICPVEAIRLEVTGKKGLAVIDEPKCVDCTLCVTRCPTYALTMVKREVPLEIGTPARNDTEEVVSRICRAAHMYPEQVVCYCHRVQAGEIVEAILQGAQTPEDVALATGARTGCGVLCITGIIRLLRGAGITLTKAPGYQWYGIEASIWKVPAEVRAKYPQYYVDEDRRDVDEVFPSGEERSQ